MSATPGSGDLALLKNPHSPWSGFVVICGRFLGSKTGCGRSSSRTLNLMRFLRPVFLSAETPVHTGLSLRCSSDDDVENADLCESTLKAGNKKFGGSGCWVDLDGLTSTVSALLQLHCTLHTMIVNMRYGRMVRGALNDGKKCTLNLHLKLSQRSTRDSRSLFASTSLTCLLSPRIIPIIKSQR